MVYYPTHLGAHLGYIGLLLAYHLGANIIVDLVVGGAVINCLHHHFCFAQLSAMTVVPPHP